LTRQYGCSILGKRKNICAKGHSEVEHAERSRRRDFGDVGRVLPDLAVVVAGAGRGRIENR